MRDIDLAAIIHNVVIMALCKLVDVFGHIAAQTSTTHSPDIMLLYQLFGTNTLRCRDIRLCCSHFNVKASSGPRSSNFSDLRP